MTTEIDDINRQIKNLNSKSWKNKNADHTKLMNRLRSEKHNIIMAIPVLKEKLERYEKRLPQIDDELRANSRYRILGQKRKRNFRRFKQND